MPRMGLTEPRTQAQPSSPRQSHWGKMGALLDRGTPGPLSRACLHMQTCTCNTDNVSLDER